MTPPAVLGIAIVSWNVRSLLERCLRTVFESAALTPGLTLRVVVVDNASSDGSPQLVSTAFPQVTLIANDHNRGFTAANNQAFADLGVLGDTSDSAPEFVLILNPDTEVLDDALGALIRYLRAHPDVAAVGPLLLNPDGTVQSSRRRFPNLAAGLFESTPWAWHWPDNPAARRYRLADVPPTEPGPVDWVTGAAILFRSEALRKIGGFDEGFFMYAEELDLCRRLRDAGWATHFFPTARIVHHEGQSSGQVVPARHLHFSRSRVRFFRKHHGHLAAEFVRWNLLVGYAVELAIEGAKGLVGHRRALRLARVRAYWGVLRDGVAGRV